MELEEFMDQVHFYDERTFSSFIRKGLDILQHGESSSYNSPNSIVPVDAFLLCDVGMILHNVGVWRAHLPRVGLVHRLSANPDPTIVRAFNHFDVKFSVSSGPEIDHLRSLGVQMSNVSYTGMCKLTRHVKTACINDVNRLSFSSMSELRRINQHHHDAILSLHFQPSFAVDSKDCHPMTFEPLFIDSTYLVDMLTFVREHGLLVDGLQVDLPEKFSSKALCNAMREVDTMILLLRERYDIVITSLNLGSAIPTFSVDPTSNFQVFASIVNEFAERHPRVLLVAEPVDFLVWSAVQLCCSVVGMRLVTDSLSEEARSTIFYYLNDGLYGSLSRVVHRDYDASSPTIVRRDFVPDETFEGDDSVPRSDATFWGPTCDSMDKICSVKDFPVIGVGDFVVFQNLGAYSLSCASSFNGFEFTKHRHIMSYQRMEQFGLSLPPIDEKPDVSLVDPVSV